MRISFSLCCMHDVCCIITIYNITNDNNVICFVVLATLLSSVASPRTMHFRCKNSAVSCQSNCIYMTSVQPQLLLASIIWREHEWRQEQPGADAQSHNIAPCVRTHCRRQDEWAAQTQRFMPRVSARRYKNYMKYFEDNNENYRPLSECIKAFSTESNRCKVVEFILFKLAFCFHNLK